MATKLVSVVGARPQFIKLAPICRAIERHNARARHEIDHVIMHTGQHYDRGMSDIFFEDLELPTASINLGVGSGRHGAQTAQMLSGLEDAILTTDPQLVLTYGDTNSTLAGVLVATKLHVPTAHVEAGLRSFNRRMPEEINRVVADHVSDLLLAPTPTAVANLEKEGQTDRVVLTGDLMLDAVRFHQGAAGERAMGRRFGLEPGAYGVVTIHRAENTDSPARLMSLTSALDALAERGLSLVFPVHPRTAERLRTSAGWSPHPRITLMPPVGYLDMLWLLKHASVALTDSGGLQKEAFFLGCPCVTLRDETEWVETVQWGGNILAGTEPDRILTAASAWQARHQLGHADFSAGVLAAFGDGQAAERVLAATLEFLSHHESRRNA